MELIYELLYHSIHYVVANILSDIRVVKSEDLSPM
jgi:hypothetical protein